MQNFNITVDASGTLVTGKNIQYIFTLVLGGVLHQFDLLSADIEGANPITGETIILVLALYFTL